MLDDPDPLTWNSTDCESDLYSHGVKASRPIDQSRRNQLMAWCDENIGQQGWGQMAIWYQHQLDHMWMCSIYRNAFFFKTEADMVMFMLAHTGFHDGLA